MTIQNFTGDIDTTDEARLAHARDASAFMVMPSTIVYPKNINDVIAVVKHVAEEKKTNPNINLSVRAGGTCMSAGSLNDGYMLNMTRYMNAIHVDKDTMTATVEMGAYFRDIEALTEPLGIMFAPYPSSRKMCGIGGMIGNNASGEKSVRFGATINNVLSVTVVLADGSVIITEPKSLKALTTAQEQEVAALHTKYGAHLKERMGRVTKVASGYRLDKVIHDEIFDMTPLFVGAQGTLGIIVSAKLRLVPIPQHTELIAITIDSLHDLPFILTKVKEHNPECVETFDIHTFEQARIHLKEIADTVEPFITSSTKAMVLAQFSEENDDKTSVVLEDCLRLLHEHNVRATHVTDTTTRENLWQIRRNSFTLVRDHNKDGIRAVPCIEDVILPLDQFETFVQELIPILEGHGIKYAYHGHIGDGSLRIIPLFDFNDANVGEKIIALTHDVFTLIKKLGGNMCADHSDGIIRTPFVKDFYGEELYGVFETIKHLFDPEKILNPRKKVDGTKGDLIKALDNKK